MGSHTGGTCVLMERRRRFGCRNNIANVDATRGRKRAWGGVPEYWQTQPRAQANHTWP